MKRPPAMDIRAPQGAETHGLFRIGRAPRRETWRKASGSAAGDRRRRHLEK